MRIIETPIFTTEVVSLLEDDEYRQLQIALVLRPEAGAVIPGSAGLRKLRWRQRGGGKRGGLRVIYYWKGSEDTIYLLLIYSKARRKDLTPRQVKTLRSLLEENLEWTTKLSRS